jgi:hypothetical protein
MAYATKYTLTWKDYDDVTWVAYFKEDGFSGSITALTPGSTPCVINWNSSEKYQPIVGTHVDFQILYEEANDLYVEGNRDLSVEIQRSALAVWYGYVSPGQYLWRFNEPVSFVTITANDCLGELKNIKFEDGSGDPYFGQAQQAVVIANILLKTGLTFPIWEAVNIFDDNHTTGAAYSALNQTYIYQEKYWNEQTDERSNCYEVLEDILRNYGASVRQYNSLWLIQRPNSYSMDTIYWRVFNFSGVYSSNTSSTSYNSIDSDHFYIRADQEITKLAGISKCEVTQSPPRRENALANGSFDSFTWDGSDFDYWNVSGTPNYTSSTNRLLMRANNNISAPTEYIYDTVNITKATAININFDYIATFTGTPTAKSLILMIREDVTGQYLTPTGWTGVSSTYAVTPTATVTDYSVSIEVPEVVSGGGFDVWTSLIIRIYEYHNENTPASNYVYIDNFRVEATYAIPDTKVHSYDNTASINNVRSIDAALGDSWRDEYYTGVSGDDEYYITTYDGDDDVTTDWSITGDPTTAAPLCEVLARQTVEGYRRSLDLFRGTIRSNAYDMSHVTFRDSNLVDEYGFAKSFFPLGISLDARRDEWSGEWIECPPTYTDEGMEWDSHDCGGDAVITGNSLEINSWTNPGGAVSFAYFDDDVAVAGETVRVVVTITDDGSSATPLPILGGDDQTRTFGANYYTYRAASAGPISLEIRDFGAGGHTFNCTVDVDYYSITGV